MENINPIKEDQNKLIGLEIIRFISAVAVLFWHYQHFSFIIDKPIDFDKEKQPLYWLFTSFYNYGFLGVQVFWCISGFIFFWKYKDLIYSSIVTGRKFFILRFSRLYPLHVATLFLVIILQAYQINTTQNYYIYQNNDIKHFLLQLFFASSWGFENGSSFNGPIWSISVEVIVYIIFFITIKLFGKSFFLNISVLLFCIGATYFKMSSPITHCLAYFYIGGLAAIAFQYFEKNKYHKYISTICFFISVTAFYVAYKYNLYAHKNFPWFIMGCMPFVLYISALRIKTHYTFQKIIELAGNTTYSSYLLHFPIQFITIIIFNKLDVSIPWQSTSFFLIFMLSTFVLSHLSYKYFEMPSQLFIRKKIN